MIFECPECSGSLDIVYDYDKIRRLIISHLFKRQSISHWKYWAFYPIVDLRNIVTLGEGNSPLVPSKQKKGYLFKYEGVSPTCSFKDRGSTVEITKAKELGIKEVACASTGNMGASVATYCARAGIKATIYVPPFATKEKLAQMLAAGARIVRVKGTYDDAVDKIKQLRVQKHVYLTGDYAFRGEGEKSVGFEIIDQLEWNVPDYIVVPIGNATLISSTFKAVSEFKKVGLIGKIPKLVGVQASGCAPVVKAFNTGAEIKPVKRPKTIATAIACGSPIDGLKALNALKRSKGLAVGVTDREILSAGKELGKEGLWVEPSGAVSYAGAKKLGLKGQVVCVLTGHGLKDIK